MSPGEITKGVYHGKDPSTDGWKCPQCKALNVGKLAEGCPSCGAGTQAQRDVAAHRKLREVSAEELAAVVGTYPNYTPMAVATVAAALAHYAEHGMPGTQELPPSVMVAWARKLLAELGE